jgi:PDZ domain-containing protein
MTDSIHQAEAAALNATPGYHLQCSKQGPRVALTMPGTPAASRLKAGDVILSVNGHRVRCASEVSPLIKEMKPGQSVYMALIRRGQTLHIDVPTVPSTNGRPDKHGKTPLIGVYVQDQFVFPVKISINAGNIGGPSAGLMFSLGIVERLERRDLTHGCKIAGTGTISYNGAVGVIGGAKQKVIAAERAGAKYFFVPTGNVQEARSAHDGVTVVPIKTLEQAIQYLNHVKPCQ